MCLLLAVVVAVESASEQAAEQVGICIFKAPICRRGQLPLLLELAV
jgi:hypothetical protein